MRVLFPLISLIFITNNAVAFNNKYLSSKLETIYCPEKIHCVDNDIQHCELIGSNEKYWDKSTLTGFIDQNTPHDYAFTGVMLDYCRYEHMEQDPPMPEYVQLTYKQTSNMIPYIAPKTDWSDSELPNCQANQPKNCPFIVAHALSFFMKPPSEVIEMAGFVGQTPVDPVLTFKLIQTTYTYEQLSAACGNTKECLVDVVLFKPEPFNKSFVIGNVLVDMSENFKIKKINRLDSNYQIKQIEDFNSVEIESKNDN